MLEVFGPLYERALIWARHRHAPGLLAGLSFVEAIIFPVMPEVMLAPMCAGATQARILVRYVQPGRFDGRRGGRLRARPLRVRGGQAAVRRRWAGSTGSTRRSRTARGRRAVAVEGVLAAGDGRVHADPVEDLHLGVGHRRHADAAVPGQHGDRPRQARVPGRAGDPAGRRARGSGAAPLHRADRLGGLGAAGRGAGLAGLEGARA